MALEGKIIDLGNGRLGFENVSTNYNEPKRHRLVWEIVGTRTSGYSYCRVDESIGKAATLTYGRVNCYLGNGNNVVGELREGGATKATIFEASDLPCPSVKSGVETRYRNGQWEKLLRRGWVPA